jgi:hypothetical protein
MAILSACALSLAGCCSTNASVKPAASLPPKGLEGPMDLEKERAELKAALVARHGEAQRARIERGVDQVAALWREKDGDFKAFVAESFVADEGQLAATLDRLEATFEQVFGTFLEMNRALRWATA